jgi:hypothetical protein
MISLAETHGASPQEIVHQLRGIQDGHPAGVGPNAVLSVPDGVAKAFAEHYLHAGGYLAPDEPHLPIVGACPECGSELVHESGCVVCRAPGADFRGARDGRAQIVGKVGSRAVRERPLLSGCAPVQPAKSAEDPIAPAPGRARLGTRRTGHETAPASRPAGNPLRVTPCG